MGSFNTPTPVYSAERPYTNALAAFANFTALVNAFSADTTMNLKSNAYSAISLKGVKNVISPGEDGIEAGEVAATATVIITPKKDDGIPGVALTAYPGLMEQLKDTWAENYWVSGATVVEDTDKQAWTAKFHIETAAGDDCYFQIGNTKAILSSYNLPATLALINTWCNTNPDMDNDITA